MPLIFLPPLAPRPVRRPLPQIMLPRAYAAVSGTITAGVNETDVVNGGKTIIITLTGDEWVAAGASFDAQRQNIINGLDSAQAEATGWNTVVRDTEPVTSVVRTSNTVVTITLATHASYDITAQETITVTVPGTALVSGFDITATPTFTVDIVAVGTLLIHPGMTGNMRDLRGGMYG